MKTGIFAFTLSIFVCFSARAELKWEQTQVELRPAVGDKEAVGHFKYENTGDKPVRFKSIRTSCGCTVAQTQKEEVPPGEKGEITATLKIGGRTGTQVKAVTVDTDDPAHGAYAQSGAAGHARNHTHLRLLDRSRSAQAEDGCCASGQKFCGKRTQSYFVKSRIFGES